MSNANSLPIVWLVLAAYCFLSGGCGLSLSQRQDVKRWETEAIELERPDIRYVEDLSPTKAAWLGILPFGVGGFYVRRPGLGISGIFCWPLSLTWLPAMAYRSAYTYNYTEMKRSVTTAREEEQSRSRRAHAPISSPDVEVVLQRLDKLRREGKISEAEYEENRRKALRGYQ